MNEPRDIELEEFAKPLPGTRPQHDPGMVQVPRNMLDAMVRMSEALATRHQPTESE